MQPQRPRDPADEIETFFHVKRKLANLRYDAGIPTRSDGRICDALDHLRSSHITTFRLKSSFGIFIDREPAGQSTSPDLTVILNKATAAPFAVGTTHVTGSRREIPADIITFDNPQYVVDGQRLMHLDDAMTHIAFAGRCGQLKLRKLSVYTEGDRFGWCRENGRFDVCQKGSPCHYCSLPGRGGRRIRNACKRARRATMLVALNTRWSGGDIVLRRRDVQVRAPMQPRQQDNVVTLSLLVFDHETEYMMEPVLEGVQVLLHYDVAVVDYGYRYAKVHDVTDNKVDWEKLDDIGDDDEYPSNRYLDEDESVLGQVAVASSHSQQARNCVEFRRLVDQKDGQNIVAIVRKLLLTEWKTIILALQHPQAEAVILSKSLQDADAWLYQAFVECRQFDITFHHLILQQSQSDHDFIYTRPVAHIYDHDTSEEGEPSAAVFFLNSVAALKKVFHVSCVEYRHPGEDIYFGTGMFISLKGKQ